MAVERGNNNQQVNTGASQGWGAYFGNAAKTAAKTFYGFASASIKSTFNYMASPSPDPNSQSSEPISGKKVSVVENDDSNKYKELENQMNEMHGSEYFTQNFVDDLSREIDLQLGEETGVDQTASDDDSISFADEDELSRETDLALAEDVAGGRTVSEESGVFDLDLSVGDDDVFINDDHGSSNSENTIKAVKRPRSDDVFESSIPLEKAKMDPPMWDRGGKQPEAFRPIQRTGGELGEIGQFNGDREDHNKRWEALKERYGSSDSNADRVQGVDSEKVMPPQAEVASENSAEQITGKEKSPLEMTFMERQEKAADKRKDREAQYTTRAESEKEWIESFRGNKKK